MAGNKDVSTRTGIIEIQTAGPGRGNRFALDVTQDIQYTLGGFTVPLGGITRDYLISPRTKTFEPRPARRDQPDAITTDLTVKMAAANYIEDLDADSRFSLYVRDYQTNPGLPLDYKRVDILTDCAAEGFEFGDRVSDESEEDVELTTSINAAGHIVIFPVAGSKISTGLSSADDCDGAAAVVDEDGNAFFATGADGTDGYPYLVKVASDGTVTETGLTDLSTDVTAMVLAGEYLVIAAGTTIAVYAKDGTLNSSYTASGAINALAAIDAANIVAVGASGLVLLSSDAGSDFTAITSGTSNTLNAVAVRSLDDWWIGGASGTLLHYDSGTVSAISLPTGPDSATINAVALPKVRSGFSRDETVYIGTGGGEVWKSEDGGDNFEQVAFPGDESGSVAAIGFTGFIGQVFYVLHTTAGGASKLYRDWSGGVGGNANMEEITVPTNSGLTALAIDDANTVFVAGAVHSTAEMYVKVAK
jgi:photosystem II stability/assembly factor-like uncharacterized protein